MQDSAAVVRVAMNVLWFVLGGIWMGLAWWFYGALCFLSVVGIPWGRACFVLGRFSFFPFGKVAVNRRDLTGRLDVGTSLLGQLGNIVWFVVAGMWLALGHLSAALVCALTIVGIPFAVQHLKLAVISLWPIGQVVVTIEELQSRRAAAFQ